MIFSSGSISGYGSKGGYDGGQRKKVEGVSRVSAVTAVSEARSTTDNPYHQRDNSENEKFQELFEQNKNMMEQSGNSLSSIEAVKMSVLKQIIKKMQEMSMNRWKKEIPTTVLRTQWIKTAVDSSFLPNTCCIAYETTGFAFSTSGKNVLFDICVEMSEEFYEKYENYAQQNNMITEPIVVHVDEHITDIPNIRCMFDLDKNGDMDDIYSRLKILMHDGNGYNIRVDFQDESAGTLFQRGMMDSKRYIHKSIYNGRMISHEIFEQTDEKMKKKNNVDFSI